ncbi:hypothetical protein B0J14DRAFT_113341 [Halenospora varia]|nr:hypothetical protein B0J14DRAFT_113341 [Halenospora varia]
MSSILDLLAVPHIFKSVFGSLETLDAVRFMATCRLVYNEGKKTWCVSDSLRRFVSNPSELLEGIRLADGVIAGGLATQFFERKVWDESDLDIFVPYQKRAFMNGVLKRQGYVRQTKVGDDDEGYEEFHVEDYVEKVVQKGKKIQLIFFNGRTESVVEQVMRDFDMSPVMCFVTHRAAYCVFPWMTFVEKKAYPFGRRLLISDQQKRHVERYRERGWSTKGVDPGLEFMDVRVFGDRYTWKIDNCDCLTKSRSDDGVDDLAYALNGSMNRPVMVSLKRKFSVVDW